MPKLNLLDKRPKGNKQTKKKNKEFFTNKMRICLLKSWKHLKVYFEAQRTDILQHKKGVEV